MKKCQICQTNYATKSFHDTAGDMYDMKPVPLNFTAVCKKCWDLLALAKSDLTTIAVQYHRDNDDYHDHKDFLKSNVQMDDNAFYRSNPIFRDGKPIFVGTRRKEIIKLSEKGGSNMNTKIDKKVDSVLAQFGLTEKDGFKAMLDLIKDEPLNMQGVRNPFPIYAIMEMEKVSMKYIIELTKHIVTIKNKDTREAHFKQLFLLPNLTKSFIFKNIEYIPPYLIGYIVESFRFTTHEINEKILRWCYNNTTISDFTGILESVINLPKIGPTVGKKLARTYGCTIGRRLTATSVYTTSPKYTVYQSITTHGTIG